MEFTERDILVNCNPITMRRAKEILREDKIQDTRFASEGGRAAAVYQISASVKGSHGENYRTSVKIKPSASRKVLSGSCDCQAFTEYSGLCKHCVALLYWYLAHKEENREPLPQTGISAEPGSAASKAGTAQKQAPQSSTEVKQLIRRYGLDGAGVFASAMDQFVDLEASLTSGHAGMELELKVGVKRMYVVKDIPAFARAVANKEELEYGKGLSFVHERSAFSKDCRELVDLVVDVVRFRYHGTGSYMSGTGIRNVLLNPYELERLLRIYEGKSLLINQVKRQVRIQDPSLALRFQKVPGELYRLCMKQFSMFDGVTGGIVMTQEEIYLCSGEFTKNTEPVLRLMEEEWKYQGRWQVGKPKYISEGDLRKFCGNVLVRIAPYLEVESPQLDLEEYMPQAGEARIYLDLYKKHRVSARIEMCYGERAFNLLEQQEDGDYHDLVREQSIMAAAERYLKVRMKLEGDSVLVTDGTADAMYRLLNEGLEDLQERAELYVSDRLKNVRIVKPPRVSMGIALSSGVLELNVSMEAFDREELSGILAAYRERRTYYRLKDGNFLTLEDNSLSALAQLSAGLDLDAASWAAQNLQLPVYRAAYVDTMLREQKDKLGVERSEAFRQLIRSIREPEECEFAVPEGLAGSLYDYQKTGYRFLMVLARYGLGGILADDMGLGKTVQVIALLLKEKKKSLIVCPASLVYNWERELNRFAPSLSVRAVVGSSAERAAAVANSDGQDVLITSYDLLKRDIGFYEGIRFAYHIIDEAQYIKNAGTQAAQAVKKISSACRFALTGTPIENRLGELWSIFDFIMPGYLYSYQRFREKLELPIVQSQDNVALGQLQRMIRPFILRRMKKDVLQELPDKMEEVVYSRMTTEQDRLYRARAARLRRDLEEGTDEDFKGNRMKVLAELIRLRQICCNPSLCYENYGGGSGKLDTFLDLVSSAVDAGHRLLVFSQFTQMLTLLEQELDKRDFKVLILTGKDSKEKRRLQIDRFQEGKADVFLISLKAGGTGLNLTAADMVIHYDPWWNAAAQDQATDRAYRLGQKSKVNVIRMVTKDTVEEKILELQEKKRELVSQVLSDGGFTEQVISKRDLLDILS